MNGTVVLIMLGQDVVMLAAIGAGLRLGLKIADRARLVNPPKQPAEPVQEAAPEPAVLSERRPAA